MLFSGNKKNVTKLNKECNINFREIKGSSKALSLLKLLLAKKPGKRITPESALIHPFIT